ncbi:hypothetical protein POTOM_017677 [Populus tomentosa]|uniref:Uncharacterized protein n=1 Tax=Populus tomentosa TaxID=118781 RepID=A0A8X7ZXJ0_POPTO|nr:hypothetical protein POTOM_017677 [Populus tomentosa]
MLAFIDCGEGDPEMATLIGDYLEDFFKLGMLRLFIFSFFISTHGINEVKHMVVLVTFIVTLYYDFKEELYFKLFTLANKLNFRLILKFKEEPVHFIVVGYVPNHPTAFYKIVLSTNQSMKLERTLKMLACFDCGEGDPELATLVGDYLEDFFKLGMLRLFIFSCFISTHGINEVKHMVVLAIFIFALDYNSKEWELYFIVFTMGDKLNLGLVLKFKEEAMHFVVVGYVPNHPTAFYKIVLNTNESMKLERTLKMLACVNCGERDPELATMVRDYLEDVFKLGKLSFKKEQPYFMLFTSADKLNLGPVLKFKEEAVHVVLVGYVPNHATAFYKIVLNINESIKLEMTLKMLAFVDCGEGDPEMATLVGDYLEDFFKLILLNANESMKLERTLKMLIFVECGEGDLEMATLIGDNLEDFFKLGMFRHGVNEVKHMVVLTIFIVVLDYGFKEEEPYFKLFTLADKLNLGLLLKFEEKAVHFVVVGYLPNHQTVFYKILLNANESMKLERTLKMVAFVECGEGDPEMATLIGDNLEDFFKLVRDKLLFPLHI